MSAIVLDCSVTMAWCFEDQADAYSDRVLDAMARGEALVPCLWPLEVANVLLAAERRGLLKEADSARFLDLLSSLSILVDDSSFDRATGPVLAAAREHGLSSCDAAYLELSMRTGAPLATRDGDLRKACRASGGRLFR